MLSALFFLGVFILQTPAVETPPERTLQTVMCKTHEDGSKLLAAALNSKPDEGEQVMALIRQSTCRIFSTSDPDVIDVLERQADKGGPDIFYGLVKLNGQYVLAIRMTDQFWLNHAQPQKN